MRLQIINSILIFLVPIVSFSQLLPLSNSVRKDLDVLFKQNADNLSIFINPNETTIHFKPSDDNKRIDISPLFISHLRRIYGFQADNAVIEGILSHEYGHVLQHEKDSYLLSDRTNKSNNILSELQADFIAGYYLARKYKLSYLNTPDPTETQIFETICKFDKDRRSNPTLYLMVSMLMNNNEEQNVTDEKSQNKYGFSSQLVQMMRLSSLWNGFTHSGVTTIEEVYSLGRDLSQSMIENPNGDKRVRVFMRIGPEMISSILKGDPKFNYKNALKAIGMLLMAAKESEISWEKKMEYAQMINRNIDLCN